jgi:hypothetical protein
MSFISVGHSVDGLGCSDTSIPQCERGGVRPFDTSGGTDWVTAQEMRATLRFHPKHKTHSQRQGDWS